jgi:hypothetical protein
LVSKEEKICDLGFKRTKGRFSPVSQLQTRQADGNPIKKDQKKIHGLLQLLQWLQGIITNATKGNGSCHQVSM